MRPIRLTARHTIQTRAQGPAERLAEEVADAANRLTEAFDAECAIGKKRGDLDRDELSRARLATLECAEAYAIAMSVYVEFFEKRTMDND